MDNLIKDLSSREPSVVFTAIEALETIEPGALKAHIVSLLLNSNAWVRSRAARAMYHWDKSEAIRYLNDMLFSRISTEREVALQNSVFFPFEQIEALLLKFLTVEQEPDLIQKAGFVFMVNPDKATAYRLYEAQKSTKGLRADLINSILMGVLKSLYQAKLDPNLPLIQLKTIKQEYEKKKIKLYINHYSPFLGSEEPEIRLNTAIKFCDLIRQNISDAKILISEYLKTEIDEDIANKVRLYLESCSITLEEEEEEDSTNRRKVLYASITKDNYSDIVLPLLPELKSLDSSEQVIILRFIEKYGSKSESKYVVKCLEAKDNAVLQAAIDCVAKIDAEALQPYLPLFLKSESEQIKFSSINAFAKLDKAQALALLSRMMTSPKTSQRKNALFCLEFLDFASASDIILSAFKQEKNKEIRDELFTVLYDNANLEVFREIYFYYKTANSDEKNELSDFLNKISLKLTLHQKGKKAEDFWKEAEDLWLEEKANIAQREAYRLERVQCLREDTWEEKKELVKYAFKCHGIGLILTLLIWFCFMSPNALFSKKNIFGGKVIRKEKNIVKKTDSFSKDPINISGVIIDVSEVHKQAMFLDNTKKRNRYMLIFKDDMAMPKKDSSFSAQVLIEDYSDSVYTARVLNIF